jgi:hypothetical protein
MIATSSHVLFFYLSKVYPNVYNGRLFVVSATTNKRSSSSVSTANPPASRTHCLDGDPSLVCSWTQPHAQWRVSSGRRHTRRDSSLPARWGSIAGCSDAGRHSECRSSSFGPPPPSFGLCDSGSSPVPEGSRFPSLHQATGRRRFLPIYYGFCARAPFFFDTFCKSCLRLPRRTPRDRPRPPGPNAFGGPHHLQVFSPPHFGGLHHFNCLSAHPFS